MSPLHYLLFDLDGTLTDPFDGITRCLQYALSRSGGPVPTQMELAAYIGPPLRESFAALLQTADRAVIEQAVALYRERFFDVGMFENRVYPHIPEMLSQLRDSSRKLFVVTSKITTAAKQIMGHFTLDKYFDGIYGSEPDGRYDDKADLIKFVLGEEALLPAHAVMIGDRRHDVRAAKQNGILALGVTYGYGTIQELREAGADLLCRTPREVADTVAGYGVGELELLPLSHGSRPHR